MKDTNLENKLWYRFIKVVYLLVYFLLFLIPLYLAIFSIPHTIYSSLGSNYNYVEGSWTAVLSMFLIGESVIFILMEIIRRIFFYIAFGKKFF